MTDALGLLETIGLTPALVAVDTMVKAAPVTVIQAELNDLCGVCVKLRGASAAVETALEAGRRIAERMGGRPVIDLIHRLAEGVEPVIVSRPEFNPLIEQEIVFEPVVSSESPPSSANSLQPESQTMSQPISTALGFIETQGFTAVFEAIDTACKAANVEVVGKEKLGGGYVTVVIRGELSAVTAAIDAGQAKVEGLGQLIAAHVIARPSPHVLNLLPKG